jgi:hypothetical protein
VGRARAKPTKRARQTTLARQTIIIPLKPIVII